MADKDTTTKDVEEHTTKKPSKKGKQTADKDTESMSQKMDKLFAMISGLSDSQKSMEDRLVRIESSNSEREERETGPENRGESDVVGRNNEPSTSADSDHVERTANRSDNNDLQDPPTEGNDDSTSGKKRSFSDAFSDISSDEDDLGDFDAGVVGEETGADIHTRLCEHFDRGMCAASDIKNLQETYKRYPRPQNVKNLRTPKLNTELVFRDEYALKRERKFHRAQEGVTRSITAVAQLMSTTREAADKKSTLDRKVCFQTLSDAARMLMATHKELSQIRRENLRSTINPKFKALCNSKHFRDADSNEHLFGEDMAKKVDEISRTSKLTDTLGGAKNVQGRGRYQSYQQQRPLPYHNRGQQKHHQWDHVKKFKSHPTQQTKKKE